MKPFRITRRVEFADTDMAGIMHFANFFRFMEVAESDFLRERGMAVSWYDGGVKLGFPRVSATCDYQSPALFQDVLTVAVEVEKVGKKSVSYRFDIANQHAEPVAVGRITAVYCRSIDAASIESLEIPADLRAKLLSLSAGQLRELAEQSPPPQSWLEETIDPFSGD